jgi:hypothetical protein
MNASETTSHDHNVGGTAQMFLRGVELKKEMVAGHGASDRQDV